MSNIKQIYTLAGVVLPTQLQSWNNIKGYLLFKSGQGGVNVAMRFGGMGPPASYKTKLRN